jgi:hypothetical protein
MPSHNTLHLFFPTRALRSFVLLHKPKLIILAALPESESIAYIETPSQPPARATYRPEPISIPRTPHHRKIEPIIIDDIDDDNGGSSDVQPQTPRRNPRQTLKQTPKQTPKQTSRHTPGQTLKQTPQQPSAQKKLVQAAVLQSAAKKANQSVSDAVKNSKELDRGIKQVDAELAELGNSPKDRKKKEHLRRSKARLREQADQAAKEVLDLNRTAIEANKKAKAVKKMLEDSY